MTTSCCSVSDKKGYNKLIDPDNPERIYRVIDNTETDEDEPRARPTKKSKRSKGKTHIPHKPKTKVQQGRIMEDYYVIHSGEPDIFVDLDTLQQADVHEGEYMGKTSERGNSTVEKLQLKLNGVMQPLERYSRMAAYWTLQQAKSIMHKHHQKWDDLFPGEIIQWPTLKSHPTNNPNLINLRYSLMHGAIRIGHQARHWMKDNDLSCPSCKAECNDVHLFLECPTSIQAWKHVEDFWDFLQDKYPTLENTRLRNRLNYSDLPWSRKKLD